MVEKKISNKKLLFSSKLTQLVENYQKILIVAADHVSSKQMAQVRKELRGRAVLLMGKNTIVRKVLKDMSSKIPQLQSLLEVVRLNIGFVFCIDDPVDVRKIVLANRSPQFAKQGVFSPVDVFVPAGNTSLDPSQTSFFQALGIATKIVRSQIEIQSNVHLIKEGEKVTASAASLLQKLNIKPFTYGLAVHSIYDNGDVFAANLLDISKEEIQNIFKECVKNIGAVGLAVGLPSSISIPHEISAAFRQCIALTLSTDISFPEVDQVREAIAES